MIFLEEKRLLSTKFIYLLFLKKVKVTFIAVGYNLLYTVRSLDHIAKGILREKIAIR